MASYQDVAAGLRANGVGDPEHWAKVITDHGPYPKDDPSQTKLREVLIEEHADPDTIAKILNSVRP